MSILSISQCTKHKGEKPILHAPTHNSKSKLNWNWRKAQIRDPGQHHQCTTLDTSKVCHQTTGNRKSSDGQSQVKFLPLPFTTFHFSLFNTAYSSTKMDTGDCSCLCLLLNWVLHLWRASCWPSSRMAIFRSNYQPVLGVLSEGACVRSC